MNDVGTPSPRLPALGAQVDYNDPYIPETPRMRHYRYQATSKELGPAMLESYDAVIIATNHSNYPWDQIAEHAKLVVDTRNALKDVVGDRENIVRA